MRQARPQQPLSFLLFRHDTALGRGPPTTSLRLPTTSLRRATTRYVALRCVAHLSNLTAMATTLLPDLGDIARLSYRDAFVRAVAEQRTRPLILPFGLLGSFVLTPLWLAVPHTKRPWLYRTRWLVAGLVVSLNLDLIYSVSSYNVACAYGAGLMGFWGILSNLHLLVWSRPQFDAARAVLLPTGGNRGNRGDMIRGSSKLNGEGPQGNGLRQRRTDPVAVSGSHIHATSKTSRDDDDNSQHLEPDYVWQTFPEHGSFLQRLNWSMDLVTNFRCIGAFGLSEVM